MQVAVMQTQCLSRVPTVATHVCRCSGLRPNRTATLSSVHQISGHSAALSAVRGAGCLSHRQPFATRAESGNGASASTSGLPIDLKGIHPVMRSHEAEDCKLQSNINRHICSCRQESLHRWCSRRPGMSNQQQSFDRTG